MTPIPVTRTIAKPDIDGCPVGFLFRGRDRTREAVHFADMEAPLNHPHWRGETYLYLIEDEEGKALEQIAKSEATIVTKDPHLTDCRVEAEVRQFIPGAFPNCDDEYCRVARNGLVFRMQDLRRYYQLCLEDYDRVVLYRRWDYDRTVLGEERFPIDPTRYHHLIAEVCGDRIRCWCDGRLVANVHDQTYPAGLAGIRMNSICRFRGIAVSTWEAGHAVSVARMGAAQRRLAELRETIPRPVVWRSYDAAALGAGTVHFFRPEEQGVPHILVATTTGDLRLFDLNGDPLWSTAAPDAAWTRQESKFADTDGDGIKEIITLWTGGITVHRAATGDLLAWAPLPAPGPFDRNREKATISHVYPADLEGTGVYQSLVVKDDGSAGGWTFWVYEAAGLEPQWSRTVNLPPFGHNFNLYDVNGDGREEILAGYHCYNGEGERIWTVEAARYWDIIQGARHPDSVIAGPLEAGAPPRAAYASGGEGFILVDATCGAVLARHRIGHAQGVIVGKFDKDLPGHQILVGTRHETYGILCFFDGTGKPIGRFQPDYVSQGGTVINWTGDGTEYILLSSSPQVFGMWDLHGHYMMDFKTLEPFSQDPVGEAVPPVSYPVDLTGDPRDEFAILHGGRLSVFTQDRPSQGRRIYAPIRNERILYPAISFERWVEL